MKHYLTTILIVGILFITGCNTTRKMIQSSTSEQITSQTTTTAGTSTESAEAINTRINLNEHLSAVIDFTRYEYSDGTIQDVVSPAIPSDSVRPRNREQTEPPNLGKNLKAVTTGRINLSKDTEQTQEAQATNETKNQTSLASQNNTTFNSSQDTKTTEKPKRGIIYYIGALTVSLIVAILLGLFIHCIRRKKTE